MAGSQTIGKRRHLVFEGTRQLRFARLVLPARRQQCTAYLNAIVAAST
jgi:hypothetical protein